MLGRERTVIKDRTASGDKIKQVIVKKQNKDGTVSYRDKLKRKKKGKMLKESKIKGKGTYNFKTGNDIFIQEKERDIKEREII